jgi:hypothetical protein
MLHVPARLTLSRRRRRLRIPVWLTVGGRDRGGVPPDHDHPSADLSRTAQLSHRAEEPLETRTGARRGIPIEPNPQDALPIQLQDQQEPASECVVIDRG